MSVIVLSKELASAYEPLRETKAIRIIDSDPSRRKLFRPLVDSPLYTSIRSYVFDDVDPRTNSDSQRVPLTDSLARRIIREFNDEPFEDLLVHCSAGLSRSPAVAIALAELFEIEDPVRMKSRYRQYNYGVYHILIREGNRLKSNL